MKYESVQQAREALKKLEQTQAAYNHALGVLYLDAATAAPSDTWEGRIVLRLCLVPYALGVVNQHGIGDVFLRRDTVNLVVAFAQNLYLPLCLGIEFIGMGFQIA